MSKTRGMQLWCNASITPKIKLTNDSNTLSLEVDNVGYTITLNAGDYTTSHNRFSSDMLIDHINNKLSAVNAPVFARLGGIHDDSPRTVLVFEHKEIDPNKKIEKVSGSAVSVLVGEVYSTEEAIIPIDDKFEIEGSISARLSNTSSVESKIAARRSSQTELYSEMTVPSKQS